MNNITTQFSSKVWYDGEYMQLRQAIRNMLTENNQLIDGHIINSIAADNFWSNLTVKKKMIQTAMACIYWFEFSHQNPEQYTNTMEKVNTAKNNN